MIATPATDSAIAARLTAPIHPNGPFGVYVHVPFCSHICPYCDFNTYAGQEARIPAYVAALEREAESWAPRFAGRTADSIFIGGGTPSQLTAVQIGAILTACQESFRIAPDAEITIETNPNDLSPIYCESLLRAGVNRISIGAQTLDRRGLRVLGRRHEAADTAAAASAARSAGFVNLSLDFIYGWPGQTLAGWRDEVASILDGALGGDPPDHVSLYGLIVEPGTPMADAVTRGILVPIDDDACADLYEAACDILADAGWFHYEISNWAATPALNSRHNALYWRNGEYAGLGAGAHGYLGSARTMNQPSPRRYIELVTAGELPVTNRDPIDARTAMAETMMLGLRLLHEGVSPAAFFARHGVDLGDQFGPVIDRLTGLGLLTVDDAAVRLTPRGVLLANSVCAEFLAID